MKKLILALVLVLALTLSLAACGNNTGGGANSGASNPPASTTENSTSATSPSSATDNTNGGGNQNAGVGWPDSWPSDIPKMDATVLSVTGDGVDTAGGLGVNLQVTGDDVVTAYMDSLVSQGWTKVSDDTAKNDKYSMNIIHQSGSQYCVLSLIAKSVNGN